MAGVKLDALTKKLLSTAKLEPAPWLDGEDEAHYGKLVPLKKIGIAASPDLIEYMKLAEDPKFRQCVGAILQKRGSFYWGLVPVRSPATLLFKRTSSEVVAFLMGSSVLASDPDSGAYLTASWEIGASQSIVASFLFNDVAPSDRTPGDFVVEALSIEDHLEAYGDAKRRPKKTLPACRELARLYRRGIWLAQLVQEDDLDSIEDIAVTVRDASPSNVYAKEREQLDTHPHFAAYWLLSHALLGQTEALADALERTKKTKNPTILDLRKKLASLVKKPSLAKLFAKARPDWTTQELATIRSWAAVPKR